MYIHVIDRSNLDDIVALVPQGDDKPRRKLTRREDLEESRFMTRSDILLINGLRTGKEYCCYAGEDGTIVGDTFVLDFITDAQLAELQAIAKQMWLNALTFPPAMKLIVGSM